MALRHLKNVTTLTYEPGKCAGCGLCAVVCPHGVFEMNGRAAAVMDRDRCMECGACARNCAFGAIAVRAGVGCASAVLWSMRRR